MLHLKYSLSSFSLAVFCLPLLLFQDTTDKLEAFIGPLTPAQQTWLEEHATTKQALAGIAGKQYRSEQVQADAIFEHFTTEADPLLSAIEMAQEIAILKVLHPDWSKARLVFTAAWNVTKGQAHTVLDLAGLAPGFGEGMDLLNGLFYCLEGDKTNAAFSFGAMVPFLGWTSTGAKYAGKIAKTALGGATELKFIVNSSGFITFGSSGQLAKVLGKKVNHRAHHLIPWSKNAHEVVQKAGDSGNWHPNLALNGMLLDKAIHNGYDQAHRIYNTRVEAALNEILDKFQGAISPQKAAQELEDLANDIREQLALGKKLNEIVF